MKFLFFLTSCFKSLVLQKKIINELWPRIISTSQITRFESPVEYLKDGFIYKLDFMGKHP